MQKPKSTDIPESSTPNEPKAEPGTQRRFVRSLEDVERALNVPRSTLVKWRDDKKCPFLQKSPYDLEAINLWLTQSAKTSIDPAVAEAQRKLELENDSLEIKNKLFSVDKGFLLGASALAYTVYENYLKRMDEKHGADEEPSPVNSSEEPEKRLSSTPFREDGVPKVIWTAACQAEVAAMVAELKIYGGSPLVKAFAEAILMIVSVLRSDSGSKGVLEERKGIWLRWFSVQTTFVNDGVPVPIDWWCGFRLSPPNGIAEIHKFYSDYLLVVAGRV